MNDELMRRLELIEDRLNRVHAFEYATLDGVHTNSFIFDNVASLAADATQDSGDIRGSYGVPTYARGIWAVLYAQADAVDSSLYVDSADDTPDVYSSRLAINVVNVHLSALVMVRLGLTTGANSGKIKLKAAGATFSNIYLWPVGWWG